jgi:hypothetical protein
LGNCLGGRRGGEEQSNGKQTVVGIHRKCVSITCAL